MPRLTTAIVLTATSIIAVACGGSSPAAPSVPSAASPPARFTVSGTVFEIAGHDRRPVSGVEIGRFIEQNGGGTFGTVATTDADGRYSLADIPSGTRIALVVARRLQPCAAVATVLANTVLDIHLLKGSSDQTPPISPTLAGGLFLAGDGPRRPYREGAAISFFSNSVAGGHTAVALTYSDGEGRFKLCRLPPGPGTLYVHSTWDDSLTPKPITVTGDTDVEIELPPGAPLPPALPPPNLEGTYSLRLDTDCAAIPAPLRSRTYTAVITGWPNFVARLSDRTFRQDPTDGLLNAFSGWTMHPDRVSLSVHSPGSGRWGIVEQITATTFLEIAGFGSGVSSGSVIEGTINGGTGFGEDLRDDSRHVGCTTPIRFHMTRR